MNQTIVSLKSFGDFIIARWALQRLGKAASDVSIIMGDHLIDLDAALGPYLGTYCIRHCEGGVPAMYDIKKLGTWRGIRSAFHLRQLFSELNLPPNSMLIFDKMALRERFIASTYPSRDLPKAQNIYLAYQQLLGFEDGIASQPTSVGKTVLSKSVGIFPGSRVSAKTLPESVIKNLVQACVSQDMRPTVFILDGEGANLPLSLESVTTLPWRFDAMASAVRSMDAVISADSMPAHMAEYFGKPVFVVSPKPNQYWLPLSCISNNRWTLFDDIFTASGKLHNFLELGNRPAP
jgi:ADP-heptose:LPS heptosyltransferase